MNGKTKTEGPEDTIQQMEFKDKINLIAEGPEEKKETRGRKPGQKNKIKNEFEGLKIGSSVLSVLVARLPNPIPLTESESELIDSSTEKVLNKYALTENFKYIDEIILGIAILGIVYPRLKKEVVKK